MNTEIELLTKKFENYFELAELDGTDLITSLDHFECSVCLEYYFPGYGVILKDCLHTFCRECIAQTIEYSTEAQVKCPYSDENYSCNSVLQDREIKALVSPEVYEKYLNRSILEAESKIPNSFHCKTANCQGWCIVDDDAVVFFCPACNETNCLKCQAVHTNFNCKQYQELIRDQNNVYDNKAHIEKMLENRDAMSCPTCHIIVMKASGCDWLRCLFCKTEICWATRGPRWGPQGNGDISAGCQCGVGGRKCHPCCGDCH